MYKALIYSVPGTGTRFTCKVLENCLSYQNAHTREHLLAAHRERVYMQSHAWYEVAPLVGYHGTKMVVPLRNPYTAYVTRSNSHRTVEGARIKIAGFWKHLMTAESQFDMCFLPVDYANLNRERLLQSIALHLDCEPNEDELKRTARDWKKVGSRGPTVQKGEWEKSRTIRGEIPTFLADAEDWYYEKIAQAERL